MHGAGPRREPSNTSQAGSRQGWSCRTRMVPVWKGGGSVYVISYQPEVDCLTAVDGLQVDAPEEYQVLSVRQPENRSWMRSKLTVLRSRTCSVVSACCRASTAACPSCFGRDGFSGV